MNDHDLQRLEQLGRMKAEGSLSQAEFEVAKAKLLAASITASASSSQAPPPPADAPSPAARSATWQFRFDFLSRHGLPHTRSYTEAVKPLPFGDKMKLSMSGLAFILGPFYFAYLGLWRPALSILGGSIIYSLIVDQLGLPASLDRVSWVVPAAIYGTSCIPLYFLKETQGVHDWNPFVSWKRQPR